MPGKFVTRAAERAGVSIETAEHRWKEAKAKVHKGKRRGSWYWGKVMNTFKRMMGLMENVTLQEWLLFESDSPFASWPEQFHLYDRYVAVKVVDDEYYVSYDVEALMGESTKIQLSAGSSKLAANPDEVSYTLGYDRDFTQKLGIRSDAKFVNFKEWAVDAVQKFIEREGLAEARATSAKDKRVEPDWVPFSVEPISGKWPEARTALWNALDQAFGDPGNWDLKDKNKEHADKWKGNQPVTYVHRSTAKLDYQKLKAGGFRISFLPD